MMKKKLYISNNGNFRDEHDSFIDILSGVLTILAMVRCQQDHKTILIGH